MKKLLLFVAVFIATVQLNAQEVEFGAKVGYTNLTAKVDAQGVSVSASESGFFVGLTSEFSVSPKFSIQPEVIYSSIEEVGFLYVPVLAKYYISNDFSLQAGPQINYTLEDLPEEKAFGLDLAVGAGYDITENFFIDARYGFELTNRYSGTTYDNVSAGYNTLMVGVGYKF